MKFLWGTGSHVAKRYPTTNEEDGGYETGPADIDLDNGWNYGIGQELRNVVLAGGVTPSNGSTSQLLSAINNLIAAATGVGETSQFLLIDQAATRLPIWPEVQTDDGKFNVTSPGVGQARLPADVTFTHRGVVNYTTVETDFTLYASRTYHVRWNPTDGWQALDLSDVAYNPSALAENDPAFDTTYDDMLVARLVTNATNTVTVTNLANKNRLVQTTSDSKVLQNTGAAWVEMEGSEAPLNWGRAPILYDLSLEGIHSNATVDTEWDTTQGQLGKLSLRKGDVDRYGAAAIEYLYDDTQGNAGHARYSQNFFAL